MRLWPLKMIVKLVLSWVPGKHVLLRSLGIFRHGDMDDENYARAVFEERLHHAYPPETHPNGPPEGFTVLELGPGDSLITAQLATEHGAAKVWLVDAGAYAARDLLEGYNAEYLTEGLASLRTMPSGCVDFIFSQAVLEHVRKAEFEDTLRELGRILKPDGVMSHKVDLRDHLDHALNNLRFSEALWEQDWMARAGFYTNRIGCAQGLTHMKNAGLDIIANDIRRWDSLPTPKHKMAKPFCDLEDEELRISGYTVLLKSA